MRRHLYLQIYAAFLGVAVLCAVVAALTVRITSDFEPNAYKAAVADLLSQTLPKVRGPELDATLNRLGKRLAFDMVLFDPRGAVLSSTRPKLAEELRHAGDDHWWHERGVPAMRLRLPDGRSLAAVSTEEPHAHRARFFGFLAAILLAAAIGCYPVARRITRRLERLQRTIDRFGSGDLSSRVSVHGRDEVAQLAASFNRALSRIEELVTAQRRVLASASHELRSPMTRLRMAIELLSEGQPADAAARETLLRDCARDIEELDALVEDVLLSARLEGRVMPRPLSRLDVTALVRSMGARVNASVTGEPSFVQGDERLLSRLLRNLFENAQRHGDHTPIEASVTCGAGRVLISVCDGGPGVAVEERERIFEPFYRPQGHREGADGGVGLGLSLVRQIAGHHGGSVRYRARDSRGSCFEVSLPKDAAGSESAPNAGA